MAQPHLCAAAIGASPEKVHVGAEIGDDARTQLGDHVEFVGPGMDAMRQRQPLRQEADIAEIADHPLREIRIRPGPLIDGLQQVHVNTAAGRRGVLGDRFK